jgi:hypothetical protein
VLLIFLIYIFTGEVDIYQYGTPSAGSFDKNRSAAFIAVVKNAVFFVHLYALTNPYTAQA